MNRLLVFIITVCFCFSNLVTAHAQQNTVTGTVKNATNGEALAGVNVLIKGTQSGTQTDDKGEFSIKVKENATLIFSYVGFQDEEVSVKGRAVIDVTLKIASKELTEVVVIGYGTSTVKDLTAPITTVKSEEITKQPVSNVAGALQGKVAGVMISNDGKPGSSPNILIRGLSTVKSSSKPLFVVDDVFMDDIGFLSASDIESLTILKDASSCAIYGVRAANGVVIITTKKGVRNRPVQVSVNAYSGFQQASNILKMAGRDEYFALTNERMYASFLRDTVNNSYQPINQEKFNGNTNWMNEVLRGNAWMQSYDMGITGGTEKSSYYFGAAYFQQDGLLKKNDYQRFTLRGSQDIYINKYVKTGYNITLSGWKQNSPADVFGKAYVTPPTFTPKEGTGKYTDPVLSGVGTFANPSATLEYFNEVTNNLRALANAYLEVKPIRELTIKTSFTPDIKSTNLRNYVPNYQVSSIQLDTFSHLKKENNYNVNYVWDNTVTYEKRFGEHKIKALAGFSTIHNSGEYLNATAQGVPYYTDATLYLANGSKDGFAFDNKPYDKVNSVSYYGRINYSYLDRYLLTATLRRDGSSRFPSDNRWATLPSLGLGWVLTKEHFMKDVKFIDFLKVRASWGQLGNDNIPANAYTVVVDNNGRYHVVYGPYGSTTISTGGNIVSIVQPRLKWEKVQETDLGLDANLLKNRLNVTLDYYNRVTKNAIFPVTLNGTAGTDNATIYDNNADVLNRGIELSLNWSEPVNNHFSYRIGANLTTIHNEVLRLKEGTTGFYDGGVSNGKLATYTQVGHPVGEFNVLQVGGIFQNWDEIHNYVGKNGMIMPKAVPGDFKYVDVNGDGIIDNNDKVGMGSYIPKVMYGFNVGFNYYNFDMSVDFQGVAGNKIFNAKRINRFGNENYDIDFYNHSWRGEGTSNTYPNADLVGGMNGTPNSFLVESGAYFRVRNVQLGYTLPEKMIKRSGMSQLRIYVSAQNLFTFFKYNGYSPEMIGTVATGSNYPTATSLGIDQGVYPLSRIINFGVNVKF